MSTVCPVGSLTTSIWTVMMRPSCTVLRASSSEDMLTGYNRCNLEHASTRVHQVLGCRLGRYGPGHAFTWRPASGGRPSTTAGFDAKDPDRRRRLQYGLHPLHG